MALAKKNSLVLPAVEDYCQQFAQEQVARVPACDPPKKCPPPPTEGKVFSYLLSVDKANRVSKRNQN